MSDKYVDLFHEILIILDVLVDRQTDKQIDI